MDEVELGSTKDYATGGRHGWSDNCTGERTLVANHDHTVDRTRDCSVDPCPVKNAAGLRYYDDVRELAALCRLNSEAVGEFEVFEVLA